MAGALVRLVIGLVAVAGGRWLDRGLVCGPGTPGMSPYDGEPVRVVLRHISPLGAVMRADILIADDLAGPSLATSAPALEPGPVAR